MSEAWPFDRRLVRLHRDRAACRVHRVGAVRGEAAERLVERLDDVSRGFDTALDVGGRGFIAPKLAARGIETVSMDLSLPMVRRAGGGAVVADAGGGAVVAGAGGGAVVADAGGRAVVADEEMLPFAPASFDLVVASLSLHWINDLPGALIQLRRALRPDGLFLASMPVLDTGGALRRALMDAEQSLLGGASPRVSPFPELRDCAGLLQRAGFALPVADVERITLAYAEPLDLLHDLRSAGETNAVRLRDRRPPPRALLPLALASLAREGERVPVELRLAMLTGWAPIDRSG